MKINRRNFIKSSLLASGTFFIPTFLKPLEAVAASQFSGFKRLVVIQLSGGNDGLNTIIPYADDLYYKNRPDIGIPESKVIKINDRQGFHPAMEPLREIYDQGWMMIMNEVGYPNPDRSHFRSMDIWHTASDAGETLNTGWLGRYLDSDCSACLHAYNAIELDDALSLAMKGEAHKGFAVKNINALHKSFQNQYYKDMIAALGSEHLTEDNMGYLSKTLIDSYSASDYVYEKIKTYKNDFPYPDDEFSRDLKTIATFINSGLDSRVYYVSFTGFDTHFKQEIRQQRLFEKYAGGVKAFLQDLNKNNNLKDTLVLTFSEFGRRVSQNASHGTDHGTANNVFVMGGNLKKKGFFNEAPDLSHLQDGDLVHKIDFRSVYATVLGRWLEVNDSKILNRKFDKLDFV